MIKFRIKGFANYISYEPLSKNVKEISQENDWRNYQYTRNEVFELVLIKK